MGLGLELEISRLSLGVGLGGRCGEKGTKSCPPAAKMVITGRLRLRPPPPLTQVTGFTELQSQCLLLSRNLILNASEFAVIASTLTWQQVPT